MNEKILLTCIYIVGIYIFIIKALTTTQEETCPVFISPQTFLLDNYPEINTRLFHNKYENITDFVDLHKMNDTIVYDVFNCLNTNYTTYSLIDLLSNLPMNSIIVERERNRTLKSFYKNGGCIYLEY